MKTHTDRIRKRLEQFEKEIRAADDHNYFNRLQAFKDFCDGTPQLASILAQLPPSPSFSVHEPRFPAGEAGYSYMWNGIESIILNPHFRVILTAERPNMHRFTTGCVVPLCDYLVDQLKASSSVLYLLWRYKRWAEWYENKRLLDEYEKAKKERKGEAVLEKDLCRFLFESGIDYPYPQLHSRCGRMDVGAQLGTDDPLILEIKVWDSKQGYKKNRVCDGLGAAIRYVNDCGKDKAYIAVFNFDPKPLVFVGEEESSGWPARIERGCTYYFMALDIVTPDKPPSKEAEGKPVKPNTVRLEEIWANVDNASS